MRCSGSTCEYPEDNRSKQDGAIKDELFRMVDFKPKGTKELDKHHFISVKYLRFVGVFRSYRIDFDGWLFG